MNAADMHYRLGVCPVFTVAKAKNYMYNEIGFEITVFLSHFV